MLDSKWVRCPIDSGEASVCFKKKIEISGEIRKATLFASSVGNYVAHIDGAHVGDRIMTPGYTSYKKRVQYQKYDVTEMIKPHSELAISVAPGWAVGHLGYVGGKNVFADHMRVFAKLVIKYKDGKSQTVYSDNSWEVWTSEVTFSDIYNGETVDKTHISTYLGNAASDDNTYPLVADEGEKICEQERLAPQKLIVTPKGERVLDFCQNMTGYIELKIEAEKGKRIVLSFAEVLDANGNFYNANYRTAKNCVTYICSGKRDIFKPSFTFQGFRYVRIDEYPFDEIDLSSFTAIVVHSEMKRTGYFICGNEKINQLYHNIIWGQKSNYLDIPTDCPQRDERLGWTGDAQIFCETGAINYDVLRFFRKWLKDMALEQREDGGVFGTCPESYAKSDRSSRISAGWGDAATIIPWTLYKAYGDKSILDEFFPMMQKWVEYQRHAGTDEFLWLTGFHYGDWLAMDAGGDTCEGATSNDLLATAFYAHSTDILVKAGEVLGKDMSEYKTLYKKIVAAFRKYFMENGMPKDEIPLTEISIKKSGKHVDNIRRGMTQTAIVTILNFNLCNQSERPALIEKLAELIHDFGDRMTTGFLGTPYILKVLSDNGYTDLAYKLLFNEGNPSWLYSVNHGATTMWEHWNGIKEDGSFWSENMNSFNHYAYGAVGSWLYSVCGGINISGAGYESVIIAPKPDKRLGFVKSSIDTVHGKIESNWYYTQEGEVRFEIEIPSGVTAKIILPDEKIVDVGRGKYIL